MIRRAVIVAVAALSLGFGLMSPAWAGNPSGTGQPNQSCGSKTASNTPSQQSGSAPGSAFNPDGKSGSVYAGQQPQNSKSSTTNSQYDVACYQTSNH